MLTLLAPQRYNKYRKVFNKNQQDGAVFKNSASCSHRMGNTGKPTRKDCRSPNIPTETKVGVGMQLTLI